MYQKQNRADRLDEMQKIGIQMHKELDLKFEKLQKHEQSSFTDS